MKHIIELKTPPAEYPVGILTTENRDQWAKCRHHLMSTGNDEIIKLIDGSILNLALDVIEDEFSNRDVIANVAKQFMHSNGFNR